MLKKRWGCLVWRCVCLSVRIWYSHSSYVHGWQDNCILALWIIIFLLFLPQTFSSPFPFSSLQTFVFLSTSSSSSFSSPHYSVGARDYPPLSQDSFPTRWHTSRSQRRRKHYRETIKSQAASHQRRSCREVGQGVACSQVCRVFCIDTERIKECLWRSYPSCTWTSRATKKEEMFNPVSTLSQL